MCVYHYMYSVAVHHVHMHGVRAALLTVHMQATQGQECTIQPLPTRLDHRASRQQKKPLFPLNDLMGPPVANLAIHVKIRLLPP